MTVVLPMTDDVFFDLAVTSPLYFYVDYLELLQYEMLSEVSRKCAELILLTELIYIFLKRLYNRKILTITL